MLCRHRSSKSSGFTLVEVLMASGFLITTSVAMWKSMLSSMSLSEKSVEVAVAIEASRSMAETLSNESFDQLFARYNGTTADDPLIGISPGMHFDVEGLSPRDSDPDGRVGEIIFPTAKGAPGQLTELSEREFSNLPRDLNLNGTTQDADVTSDYQLLPVIIRIEWNGASGDSQLEIRLAMVGA